MTESEPKRAPVDSTIDGEIARILDEYLAQTGAGTAVSRDEFLSQHPKYAERLRECLDGVDLMSGKQIDTDLPTMFGDFEICGELGRGGMGVVYEAHQKSLDRIVALKVMRFGVVDPRALERFQREAETAGGLHHTNIVPVFATGREGDTSWYAMQRIVGESLAQRIDRAYHRDVPERVPIDEIVDIGVQAAEALDYAHKRDVVHRDVKPANLIIDQQGVVWLTDFGLARRLVDVGATLTGALMGTPRYMSPEQADTTRVDVDHHSDIYSLGATLYELATGHPPFEGDDPLRVISQIRDEDPTPPQVHRRDIPRDLQVVLLKCLAKEPQRRYASAGALAEDLRAIAEGRPIQARAISWAERAVRWSRKHERLVRSIGIAVATTIAAVLLFSTMLASWREQSLGKFRMRAAGGPFAATVRSDDSDGEPMHITVPMQDKLLVKKGSYTMQLASRGRWSRTVRFHVGGGEPNELRFRYGAGPTREVSIAHAQAVPTAGFDAPAVLLFKDETVRRIAALTESDWELELSQVSADRVTLPPLQVNPNDEPLATGHARGSDLGVSDNAPSVIDFRYAKNTYAPWTEWTLRAAPRLATPVRALDTAIDLDGDQRADSIIAAIGDAALLAIDADGNRLWCRKYEFPEPAAPRPDRWADELVLPGIVDLNDVGDLDADGINDVAVQLMRIQPTVQNDLCLAVLSGKTGEPITAVRRPPIVVANRSPWPHAGMLVVNGDRFRSSSVGFNSEIAYRSLTAEGRTIRYSTGDVGTKFALPLPIKTVVHEDRVFAVQCVGNETAVFDLGNGQQVGRTNFETPHVPPQIATHDGKPVMILLARIKQTGGDGLFAYDLNGKACWGRQLVGIDRTRHSELVHAPDWPLVEDLNGDGTDEIIAPVAFQPAVGMGIQTYRLSDGSPRWPADTRQFSVITDAWIERLTITADIDHDNWRDIATVTIAGTSIPGSGDSYRGYHGEAFVYVDWLSGRTGEPLAWARHPIPVLSNLIQVCEIDGVRSNLSGANRGIVEIELVTGDSGREELLECMTLHFSPGPTHPVSVAQGLTVCGKSTTISKSGPRWYRQRPGPFSLDEESLVLLGDPNREVQRLGENRVISMWNQGSPVMAITGEKPNRLSVVRASDLSTVWSVESTSQDRRVLPVRVADDHVDLIASSRRKGKPTTEVERFDGLTGKPVWSKPSGLHGRPIHAQYLRNVGAGDSILVVDNGDHVQQSVGTRSRRSLHMSLLDASSGRLIWRQPFLDGASHYNQPETLPNFAAVDVNGDGVTDICGPDQAGQNIPQPVLGMTMWDGRTGEKLWTRSWNHVGHRSDYEPMPWALVKIGGTQCIALIEPTTDDYLKRNTTSSIVVCNARNGRVLAKYDTEYRFALPHPRNLSNGARIADCTTDANQPRLIAWLRDEQWTPHLVTFDVTSDGIRKGKRRETNCQRLSKCWLLDVTGDNVPEALVISEDELSCYSAAGTQHWSTALTARKKQDRYVSWDRVGKIDRSPIGAIWLEGASNRLVVDWIDLRSGQIVDRIDRDADISIDDSPFRHHSPVGILASQAEGGSPDSKRADVYCVASSNDGIFMARRDAGRSLPVATEETDPRRIKRLPFVSIQRGDTAVEYLGQQAKWLFITLALFVVPVACVRHAIVHRRWTLRSFLLVPAMVMFALLAWRLAASEVGHPGELLVILLSGTASIIAVYGIVMTVRANKYGWMVVAVLTAASVLGVLRYFGVIISDSNAPFRYAVSLNELILLTVIMFAISSQMLGLCILVGRRLYRLVPESVSDKTTKPATQE